MTKIRKHNGVYKLPIHKHSRVRRPMSRWQLEYMLFENNPVLISNTLKMSIPPIKVQDISIGLENPLDLKWPLKKMPYMMKQEFLTPKEFEEMTKQQKGDWPKDMEEQTVEEYIKEGNKFVGSTPIMSQIGRPKPSLLTRVKNRFKR